MTLEEYIDSLIAQGLDQEEVNRLAKEFKPGETEDSVKTEDGVVGASAPSMGPVEAPEPTELTLEDTFSELPEEIEVDPQVKVDVKKPKRYNSFQERMDAVGLAEAKEFMPKISEAQASITEEQITEKLANDYFNLSARPYETVIDADAPMSIRGGGFGGASEMPKTRKEYQSIEDYLGPDKYEQYQQYQETGELISDGTSENQAVLQQGRSQARYELSEQIAQLELRNVPENVQRFFGDVPLNTVDEAEGYLEFQKNNIESMAAQNKEQYASYQADVEKLQVRFDDVKYKINEIGEVDSEEKRLLYNELVTEGNAINAEYTDAKFEERYNSIVKQQQLVNSEFETFKKKTTELSDRKVLEKAASLDYSFSAKAGMAMEEFFVKELYHNFGTLLKEVGMRGVEKLTQKKPGEYEARFDDAIDVMRQSNQNYNLKIAKKREDNIPESLKLDDIGNNNVGFFDWFTEAFADNSPSIITTFIPGGAAVKTGMAVKSAAKLGTFAARKAALASQRAWGTAATRTAQGVFFGAGTGGKFGDIELTEANAKLQLVKLRSMMEGTEDLSKKKELQDEIDELERVSSFSLTQKAFTSFGFGTTEMFAESLSSLKLVTGASRVAKSMGKQQFKKEVYGRPINFASNVTKKVVSGLSPLVKGGTTEVLEETVTQLAHNGIDIIVLGENKSLIEGIDKDFLANVLVTSGGIMAPKTSGNVLNILKNEFRIKSELKANQELATELINLSAATSNMSKAEQVAARSRKSEIIEKLGLSDAMSLHKLRYMTPSQIDKAADLSRQERELKKELYRLGASGEGSITPEGRKAKDRLTEQLENIIEQKESILNAKEREVRKNMSEFLESLDSPIQNKNGEIEYYAGLFDFYQDTAMSLMPKNGKYISIEDISNIDSDLSGFSEQAIAEVKAGFEGGARAAIIGNSIVINNKAIMNGIATANNFVDGKYAAIAPLEELFHLYNKANGVTKGGELDKMSIAAVDEAIEVLKDKKELGQISDKEYNNLIARFELYKEGRGKVVLKSGKRGGAKVDSEEVLAQINNAIALGVFNREDISNIPSLRGFINGISNSIFGDSSWMFNLKTAEDVFKFAENFQKSIQDGVAVDSSSEEEEVIKNSMSTAQDLNWKQTDEALVANFKVGDRNYKTTLEETAFMEFDEGQTYQDIEDIASDLGIAEDAEGDPIESSEKFYHLEFGDTELGKGITGEGNAFEVFSTAINGVSDYLKNNSDVEGVVFTAKEPSRIRLYKTLSKVLAEKIGGSFGFKNDTFIVSTKKPKQESQVKFSLSASDSAKVNELYETQGDAALMDVVDLMTPTAKGLTENFRNRPKYSEFKDQLKDEILNGRRGIMEVIMGYPAYVEKQKAEGKAVAPLSGYLNNSFSTKTGFKRYIEIADRILGKDEQSQFTQEINNESLNVANDEDIDISDFSSEISQSTINALKAAGLSTVESVLDQDIASIVKQTKLDTRVIEDAVDVFREELDVRSGSKQLDAKERESLRKKIALTPEVTQKVRDAVSKTFGTKLPDIDSPKFKTALQKAFRTELKTTMAKDVMGSRAAFETFLRDNFETIFEVIPQGVMNKRFKAFIEPVLDVNGKQKREKTPQGNPVFKKKPIVKAEFIKYFLGREVGGSTKGTRKDALAEALAEEFAFDATMETIQTEDVATKREFLDKGQTTEKVSKKIGRPSTMKFNRAVAVENLFQKLPFEKTKDDFNTLNGFRWGSILQATLAGSGVSAINMKTQAGRQRFKDYAVSSGLISLLPKAFWRSMQGSTENLLKDTTKKSGEDVKETREFIKSLREDPSVVTDKEFDTQFRNYTGNLPFKSVQEVNEWIAETEANGGVFAKDSELFNDMLKKENPKAKNLPMEKALNNPAFVKRQENSINGLKKVFEIFQDTMKDPEGIAFVAALMSSSGASQNHFIRKSAPWRFYQKSYLDEAIREEHTLPASLIGKYLFISALSGTVSSDFGNVKKNFFQGALSKVNDDKLKGEKLNGKKFDYVESTPEGWKITDNIWARYFNINVGLNAGGINPSDLILANNKSVYDIHNVTSTGVKVDSKAKFSRSVANDLDSSLVPGSIKYNKPVTTQTLINALAKTDKSLELARKLDQPVKKIRVFDFDDTLARTKSNVLYTMPNVEGGFSEGSTKLKAIFMVGGPGAGKTNVGKGLQLGRRGYKVVNQDIALEAMKAESGLPAKESDYTAEQRSTRSKLGAAARKAAVAKFDKYATNGDGMVVDGTGASYNATTKKIKALEDAGFEVHMVVATTPLETAIERNKARVERSLPDFVVEKTYNQVQESLVKYREDFGDRLYEINTETIEYGKPLPNDFLQQVYAGINANKVGKIDAATFAKEASNMEAEGAQWNFSEFSKVMEGSKGPLLDVAKIIAEKRGTKDVFVLTARPADAAGPIKEFLASMGLDIPLANITGLGDGAPEAKAGWIMGKAAEGYNDFYFADDHTGNVKAVKDVLSQIDVKSKVQLAKFSKAATFNTIINDMIEDSSGIEAYKKYSAAKAKTVGASKGKYAFLIPPSAEDFTGLLYKMIGKGKKGDAQMAFLKANLLDPYNRAELAVTQAKVSAANDFMALKTQLKTLPKTLSKQTGIGKFTYSNAVRVAAWTRQGMEVPGLSKRDIKELNDFVTNDSKLNEFANELIVIQKGKQYPKPDKEWLGGNITTDIIGNINKVNRAEYQQEFRDNLDIIFSEDNMNKMEAAYGTRWREAMVDSIRRMKSGSNRPIGGNRVTEGLLTWLNNSVGAVMFLNTRSALLQTISAVNFINLSDNNIVKAGVAFANQPQFWKDFMTLMNSDYLVERRNGLKINVSESEIADAVKESKNKPKAAIAFLLSKGFVMTRFADSFAIASGGSTFYRNRLEALKKQGLSDADAETQAFEDFKAIAEESQQSSSPSKISQQQASTAGRVILAWANTPMQYARIQKRAAQDLINGRGDWKTNISKIVYYGAVQNLIFNTLQQAVFALGFGDDDETDEKKAEKKNKKALSVANGMIDSQLKGLGIFGAASAAMKNTLMTLYEQHGKKSPKYDEAVADLLSFSPPLGSKISKVRGGFRSFSWNRKEIQSKGYSLDNPAYLAGAQIVTGFTNVPFDRVAKKINNIRGIYSEKSALWQKVALGLGWSTWDVDLGYYGGFDEEVEKKKVSEMTREEKIEYKKQREAERAKIRKQREFERERRRIERNK